MFFIAIKPRHEPLLGQRLGMNTAIVKTAGAITKFRPPPGSTGTPDRGSYNGGPRYVGGFLIPSSDGRRNYKICFDLAGMHWTCSCPGAISHGNCKHLAAAGLKGRKYGKNLADAKKYGFIGG